MKKQKNLLFGLIGPTGAGKTEASKHMREKHGFLYIPSVTTRPPRKGNLKEYKHIEVEVFKKHIKNNNLLEHTTFAGHYYGKLNKDVEEYQEKGHCVYTLTVNRVKKLKEKYSHAKIVCILPGEPIIINIEKRLKKRNHTIEEIGRRLKTAEEDLILIEDLKKEKLIDHIVRTLEENRNHAISEINRIITKYKSL